jgi:hypothetical protein
VKNHRTPICKIEPHQLQRKRIGEQYWSIAPGIAHTFPAWSYLKHGAYRRVVLISLCSLDNTNVVILRDHVVNLVSQFWTSHAIYTLNVEYYPMLTFIAKPESDHVVLMTMTLWGTIVGYIELFQATLHSTGTDLIVWPGLLIAAWWVLIGKTWAVFKLFSLPIIVVATYFVLFISYHIILNLS